MVVYQVPSVVAGVLGLGPGLGYGLGPVMRTVLQTLTQEEVVMVNAIRALPILLPSIIKVMHMEQIVGFIPINGNITKLQIVHVGQKK
jgi:hypothetical protein